MHTIFYLACLAILIGSIHAAAAAPERRFHQPSRQGKHARHIISKDLAKLLQDLRINRVPVRLSDEKVAQPVFATGGRIIYIADEAVWIFSYSTRAAADRDVRKISLDGMTIGTSKPLWVGTPHFFRRPRLIILYLGDAALVIDALKRTVGAQFAGG